MSASRQSSWRPKQQSAKVPKSLLIAAGCIPVIAILAIALPLLFTPPVPPIQLLILPPPQPLLDSLFPLPSTSAVSDSSVTSLFLSTTQQQPSAGQTSTAPVTCNTPRQLLDGIQTFSQSPNQASRLVLYATVRPRTRIDQNTATVLDLHFSDSAAIPAADLLAELAKATSTRKDPAVLLLDLLDTHVGLEGGLSTRDCLRLLEQALEPHKDHISIICSCSAGQLSWKLPATGSSQTAFCSAVSEVLLSGKADTVAQFHSELSQKLPLTVRTVWGQSQTPAPILGQQQALLLGQIRLKAPAATAPANPTTGNAAAPSANTAPETTAAATATAAPPKTTPAAQLAELWSQLDQLDIAACRLFPAKLLQLRADLLRLNQSLTAPIPTEFSAITATRIQERVEQLRRDAEKSRQPSATAASAIAWASPAPPAQQELDACRNFITAVTQTEPATAVLPPAPPLNHLAVALWADLAARLDAPTDEFSSTTERIRRCFIRFPPASWPVSDIPWQLTLLHNALVASETASADVQRDLLRSAAKLRQLRDSSLTLLAAVLPDTAPGIRLPDDIYSELLGDTENGLPNVLRQLDAAESWLAAGRFSAAKVRSQLDAAAAALQRTTNSSRQRLQSRQQVWFRTTALPGMIQAAAQRLERRPVNSGDISLLADLAANPSRLNAGDPLIDALLLLTAPPSVTTDASAAQSAALSTLTAFLRGVGTTATPLTAIDFQELEAIPPSPAFPADSRPLWSKSRDTVLSAGASATTQPAVNPSQQAAATNTGLWIGLFSIRLRETASHQNSPSAQAAWQTLCNELRSRLSASTTAPATPATVTGTAAAPEALRAILFNALANDWQRLAATDTDPGAAAFPTDDRLKRNIQDTLSARFPVSPLSTAWAREVPPTFCGPVALAATPAAFSDASPRQIFLSPESTASFKVQVATGQPESRQLLINVPQGWRLLSPQPASIEPDADGWLLLPPASTRPENSELSVQLQPSQPLPTNWSSSLILLAAIDNGRVADLLPVQLLPRPDTQWRLVSGPDPTTLVPESSASPYAPAWRLYLPPSTAPDKPQTLTFSLQQSAGPAVPSVRVQLLQLTAAALPGTPLPGWEQPLLFNLSPNQPLNLPLQPPQAALPPAAPAAPPAPATPAAPAAISFPYGFCVRVQPVLPTAANPASAAPTADPTLAPESLLVVKLRFSDLQQFVEIPERPQFDPVSGRLSLGLRPASTAGAGPMPAELHLSPELKYALVEKRLRDQNILPPAFGSPEAEQIRLAPAVTPIPDLAAASGGFQFDLPVDPPPTGIFSLSAAGLPFARAWRLTDAGLVESLDQQEGDPENRLLLEVLNASPSPTSDYPELVFPSQSTADGKDGLLRVGVHLHGVVIDPATDPRLSWTLRKIQPQEVDIVRSQPRQEPINSGWNRQSSATSGPNALWMFSCSTQVLAPFELNLKSLDPGSAKYVLTFRLTRRDAPEITASLTFTMDQTQPPEAVVRMPAVVDRASEKLPACQISDIADPETRVVRVEAGFDKEKLRLFWPSSTSRPGDPSPASLDLTQLLRPENLPPAPGNIEIPLTLHLKLTNAAGRTRLQEHQFRLISSMATPPAGPAPPASITVEVAPAIKGRFKVTLVQSGLSKEASAAAPARFENLAAGKHTVQWEPVDAKLSGPYAGIKTITLAAAPPAPPPAPGSPPPQTPPTPPGEIPPQKIVIGQ